MKLLTKYGRIAAFIIAAVSAASAVRAQRIDYSPYFAGQDAMILAVSSQNDLASAHALYGYRLPLPPSGGTWQLVRHLGNPDTLQSAPAVGFSAPNLPDLVYIASHARTESRYQVGFDANGPEVGRNAGALVAQTRFGTLGGSVSRNQQSVGYAVVRGRLRLNADFGNVGMPSTVVLAKSGYYLGTDLLGAATGFPYVGAYVVMPAKLDGRTARANGTVSLGRGFALSIGVGATHEALAPNPSALAALASTIQFPMSFASRYPSAPRNYPFGVLPSLTYEAKWSVLELQYSPPEVPGLHAEIAHFEVRNAVSMPPLDLPEVNHSAANLVSLHYQTLRGGTRIQFDGQTRLGLRPRSTPLEMPAVEEFAIGGGHTAAPSRVITGTAGFSYDVSRPLVVARTDVTDVKVGLAGGVVRADGASQLPGGDWRRTHAGYAAYSFKLFGADAEVGYSRAYEKSENMPKDRWFAVAGRSF